MTTFLDTNQTPATAWDGYLEPLGETMRGGKLPRISLGEPAIWEAAAAVKSEIGRDWTPPIPGWAYTLIRLSCTLHPPDQDARYTEARLEAPLGVGNGTDRAADRAIAHDLFPMQQTVQEKGKHALGLNPELKFAKAIDLSLLEVGVEKEYAAVFPVIQAYGLGEANPYWQFQAHDQFPLQGSQKVYLLAAAPPDARVRLHVRLTVSVEHRRWGVIRYTTPQAASAHLTFDITS